MKTNQQQFLEKTGLAESTPLKTVTYSGKALSEKL
jgi:hypothetical protein